MFQIGASFFNNAIAASSELAKSMHFTAAVDTVDEALKLAHELLGEHPATILMPEGSLTVPRVAK